MTLSQVSTIAAEVAVSASAIVGALYSIASGLAAILPPTWPLTHSLARWAGDLRKVRKTEAEVIEALVAARGNSNAIADPEKKA